MCLPRMNAAAPHTPGTSYRSVFISDIHLGTRGCRADSWWISCVVYPARISIWSVTLDGWRLRKPTGMKATTTCCSGDPTPGAQGRQRHLYPRQPRRGVPVPGCRWAWRFGGIRRQGKPSHQQPHGKRLLVIHGDEFDSVVRGPSSLAQLSGRPRTWAGCRWFRAGHVRLRRNPQPVLLSPGHLGLKKAPR